MTGIYNWGKDRRMMEIPSSILWRMRASRCSFLMHAHLSESSHHVKYESACVGQALKLFMCARISFPHFKAAVLLTVAVTAAAKTTTTGERPISFRQQAVYLPLWLHTFLLYFSISTHRLFHETWAIAALMYAQMMMAKILVCPHGHLKYI